MCHDTIQYTIELLKQTTGCYMPVVISKSTPWPWLKALYNRYGSNNGHGVFFVHLLSIPACSFSYSLICFNHVSMNYDLEKRKKTCESCRLRALSFLILSIESDTSSLRIRGWWWDASSIGTSSSRSMFLMWYMISLSHRDGICFSRLRRPPIGS